MTTTTPAATAAAAAVQVLRTELDRHQAQPVLEGAVVRFSIDGYLYAALNVGDRWYTTATVSHHLGAKVFESTREFTEQVLSRATDISVATEFSPI